ncbi:MAG: hypothetical protein ACLGI8_11455 [Acidimicrobiia bacterium]|jgi:hypothetical protein
MTDPTPAPVDRPARPPSWRYRAFVAVALLGAATALVVGVLATQTDGDDPVVVGGRADAVEHVYPRDGAEVLRQVEIGIDLAPGYEGRLVVNGEEIPESDLRLVPEQNQVFFLPGPGKVLETLPPGTTCVAAVVWRSSEGRGVGDLSVQWCFDVT